MPVILESHVSSKIPSAHVPRQEQFDLAMSKSILQRAPRFTCAHLTYLECRGKSIFVDEKAISLFMNALRLHWKVSGKILQSPLDQSTDLYELLMLEMDGVYIIQNLLTDDAIHEVLERRTPDGMMILATIVHDIYNTQWQSWSAEHGVKHKQQGRYALIITHAQAISNQLSNNVLTFKGQASPELRKWAEVTVARHLMAIVTPGHLHHPTMMNKIHYSLTDSSTSDLMNGNTTIKQPGENGVLEQGPSSKRKQMPLHSGLQPSKRRKLGVVSSWRASPYKSAGRFRAFDSYRPPRHRRPTSSNDRWGHKHPKSRNIHDRLDHTRSHHHPSTASPCDYVNRNEYQAPDVSPYEERCKVKLDAVQPNVTQQKVSAISCIGFGGARSSSEEQKTPIVKGPSYTEYLRKKEGEAALPLKAVKSRPFGHVRTQSYVGSEEGEILE